MPVALTGDRLTFDVMDSALLSALFVGFMLGMRHATDTDHVVVVTAIASGERSVARALRVAVTWGVGHATTLFVVGGSIIVFGLTVPPRLGLAFEMLVAMMLIGIGGVTLAGKGMNSSARARPLAAGLIHGLAGSAFVALLVLAAIPGWVSQLAYLGIFGLGTVAGMSTITAAIALPSSVGSRRFASLPSGLRTASALASIVFGLILAHRVGVTDGLFAATPLWVPR